MPRGSMKRSKRCKLKARNRRSAMAKRMRPTHSFKSLHLDPLEGRYLLAADFGDAPAPYPTLMANGGAEHTATGLTLGAVRDMEADGQATPNADGDDNTGSDDEDGVTFGTIQVGALDATVTVNVQGAAGRLDAWIDFNGDGSWGGPGEQIFDNVSVSTGDNSLTFDVPSWALSGPTFARFRLSTAGDLGTGGVAADGEVEDYQVTIIPPAIAGGVFDVQQTISVAADYARSVFAADVDGDGDVDVLSASSFDDKIAWYENDGNPGTPGFTAHTISTAANVASSVFAADVDGDGDTDVLSASVFDDKIAWYENDGNPGTPGFTAHTISTAANGAYSVFAVDVDGDGDTDVLSASSFDDKIAWYENDGSENFTTYTISNAADRAQSVIAADVDGDGDMDVLSASRDDDKIAWYENDGNPEFSARIYSPHDQHRRGLGDAAYLRQTWTAMATPTCSARLKWTTRSPGTRTMEVPAHPDSRPTRSAPPPTLPGACLLRTWTGTVTPTCSARQALMRSPGTRTTGIPARPYSSPTRSAPRPMRP